MALSSAGDRDTHPPQQLGERKAIVLVSAAHLISHMYYLVLPPLFPLLKATLGLAISSLVWR